MHVFLPLLDRGIDAVIHRLDDGAYLASASVGPNYELHFHPAGSSQPSRLDRYRVPLESLTDVLERNLDRPL